MANFEEIRTKYMQDVATKTSKQRFGFFSLPPSSRAANTEYFQKKGSRGDIAASKDENGRVKTKERNIYLCRVEILREAGVAALYFR